MATVNQVFGTRTQLTITLASLGNGSYREATEVSNSGLLALDFLIHGKITTGTSPTVNTSLTVYAAGSDGTTARVANMTGTDSTITPAGEQTQLEVGKIVSVDATSNHAYEFSFMLSQALGLAMPPKWSIIVLNSSGVALNATGGNHEIWYTPVNFTVA